MIAGRYNERSPAAMITPEDLAQIRVVVREETAREIGAAEARLTERIEAVETSILSHLRDHVRALRSPPHKPK
jgi:hypothetical protein